MDRTDLMKQTQNDLRNLLDEAQVRLAEFLEEKLPRNLPDTVKKNRWDYYVDSKLEEEQKRKIKEKKIDNLDLAGLLAVLRGNWHILPIKGNNTIVYQMRDALRNSFQAHRTTAEIKNPSAKTIYENLLILEKFLRVIEGDECLIKLAEKRQNDMVLLLSEHESTSNPLSPDPHTGEELSPDKPEDKGAVITVPTNESIQPAKVYFDRGLPRLTDEQYKKALESCEAIAESQKSADACNDKGFEQLRYGHYDKAKEDFTEALRHDSNYVPAYTNKAGAQIGLGHYKAAISTCDLIINLKLADAPVYTRRGDANRLLGEYTKAIEDYKKALDKDPNFAPAYNGRGAANHQTGKYEEAKKDYYAAFGIDQNYVIAYHNHGNANAGLGDYEEAIKDYTRALEINSYYVISYLYRAYASDCLGRDRDAKEDYNRVLRIPVSEDDADGYRSRGYAHFRLGKYKRGDRGLRESH